LDNELLLNLIHQYRHLDHRHHDLRRHRRRLLLYLQVLLILKLLLRCLQRRNPMLRRLLRLPSHLYQLPLEFDYLRLHRHRLQYNKVLPIILQFE
jgi:hypothetical protein